MTLKDIFAVLRGSKVQPVSAIDLVQMAGMAERNAKRIEAIKQEMGEKWILHPSHTKSRLDEPRPV